MGDFSGWIPSFSGFAYNTSQLTSRENQDLLCKMAAKSYSGCSSAEAPSKAASQHATLLSRQVPSKAAASLSGCLLEQAQFKDNFSLLSFLEPPSGLGRGRGREGIFQCLVFLPRATAQEAKCGRQCVDITSCD